MFFRTKDGLIVNSVTNNTLFLVYRLLIIMYLPESIIRIFPLPTIILFDWIVNQGM